MLTDVSSCKVTAFIRQQYPLANTSFKPVADKRLLTALCYGKYLMKHCLVIKRYGHRSVSSLYIHSFGTHFWLRPSIYHEVNKEQWHSYTAMLTIECRIPSQLSISGQKSCKISQHSSTSSNEAVLFCVRFKYIWLL